MGIRKINNNIWEINKEGLMKVPAFIYASEKLLESIKQDNTLQQAKNVACLQGIQKASYTMPDAHQGYGFPIGGVAAFDIDDGIISPGGIGYDINCLVKDSKVLTIWGYFKPIQDFEKDFVDIEYENNYKNNSYILKQKSMGLSLLSLNIRQRLFSSGSALYFMKRRHNGQIIEIKTKSGYALQVTGDHPVLTKNGMVKAESINKYHDVAIYPFDGIEFEEMLNDENILDDITIFSVQEKNELKKRNLLPLTLKNQNIPIITKLYGYLLGDGNIYLSNKKGFVCAYGKEEDLKSIKHDMDKLGFSASIYSRERDHKIINQYGEKRFKAKNYELHVSSKSLAKLFFALGYPQGNKTSTGFLIPPWIMKSPKWIKRLFLSGLFGAELSVPRTHTRTGFDCPVFSVNKIESLLNNGREFCIQLMRLLEEFGIRIDKITEREEYKNRYGKTYRVRLQVSSEEDNLIMLWSNIGFSYNIKREKLSHIGILYIKEKRGLVKKREEIAGKVKDLKIKGLRLREVQTLLVSDYANKRFIERHYYEDVKQRISFDFISFDNFKRLKLAELSEYGTFFGSIESITKKRYDDYVYDFNIKENHNFVSDNIVVSNCGVRLLRTDLTEKDVLNKRKEILNEVYKEVPAGVGKGGITKLSRDVLIDVLDKGARWAIDNGYGTKDDLQKTEEYGNMKTDASAVTDKALSRGLPQLGTLGAGNHFLEMQKVDTIYDMEVASKFGIKEKGQILVMIHCGRRGLGHQVASDYIKMMEDKYGFKDLPDRELINAPIQSELGQRFYKAMCAAVNYAFANRQMIAHWVRDSFNKVFGSSDGMEQIYDVCHNLAKFETHILDGEMKRLCIHRKGATRSFGPGREEIPEIYRSVGQPVLIPGSMGTASYVLVGTKKAEEISFGSTAHGAGRIMSRHEALRKFRGEQIVRELAAKGVEVKGSSWKGIAEEAGEAYKNIDEVVKVSHELGIGNLVCRVVPVAVMKG